ncbi:MAG: hypothetical protein IT380_21485 [Myxococcales bacterium]|nr:hypothetical protein [Myxococcales bacterium]
MKRALLVLSLALCGCDLGFRPETLVEDLRLLGVRAQPADLAPGETARLEALVLDPSRPGQDSSVLWLGCAPDPFNLNRSACSDFETLSNAAGVVAGGARSDGGTLPPGVSLIGLGDSAAYHADQDVFDALPPGDERRLTGTVGQALLFAVAEDVPPDATEEELAAVFGRVADGGTRAMTALFRVRISQSPERNSNPTLSSFFVAKERWPRGAHVTVLPGEPVELDADAPDSAFEAFTNPTPSGVEQKTERVLVAWYSTAGRFTEARTALREQVKTVFTAPGGEDETDPVPQRRTGTLYLVLRDTRGGQAWSEVPFYVCDAARPAPQVASVDWPVTAGEPVVLHGASLDQVLDVIVDEAALEDGAFSPSNGTWRGFLPQGVDAGVPRGRYTTRACGRGELPLP